MVQTLSTQEVQTRSDCPNMNTHTIKRLHRLAKPLNITKEARDWCVYWTEKAPRNLPSAAIQAELVKTRPSKSITVFRYVAAPENEHLKSLLSWSADFQLTVDSFFEGDPIWLRMTDLRPEQILVDMRVVARLCPEIKRSLLPEIVSFKI